MGKTSLPSWLTGGPPGPAVAKPPMPGETHIFEQPTGATTTAGGHVRPELARVDYTGPGAPTPAASLEGLPVAPPAAQRQNTWTDLATPSIHDLTGLPWWEPGGSDPERLPPTTPQELAQLQAQLAHYARLDKVLERFRERSMPKPWKRTVGGAAAAQATGSYTLTGTPTTTFNNTYTIGGFAVVSPQLTANTLAQQATSDAAAINANASVAALVTATHSGANVIITANTGGSAGNAITTVGSSSGGDVLTANQAALIGGTNAAGLGAGTAGAATIHPTRCLLELVHNPTLETITFAVGELDGDPFPGAQANIAAGGIFSFGTKGLLFTHGLVLLSMTTAGASTPVLTFGGSTLD